MIIVTNNPEVPDKMKAIKKTSIVFVDGEYKDVLLQTRRYIVDEQLVLLTHPLSGSIKPNETYYKSICLSEEARDWIDLESLTYIERALDVYEAFYKNQPRPNWTDSVLLDFAKIDYRIMADTLQRMGVQT
ncbi:GrdX family protein [Vagococcus acidifermentans]|uniref:GrdX protein n=1 Tax=Vagococcus acidifermentans TaxID=564710 RepID=A0A430AZB1_9ENTE|nr:GrdX family protein [Vagococcus acidifermentans]RSU13395.1 hypothetical protein CBF27_04235 [Vagococcus acidifermentans]